ncbi:hypothetical protein B0H19DRAFT_1055373 [Mycena capillaripes]|nr:hypothetical protein B0H19DRAFT_1055373 [Mycena capillaripes]
METTDTFIDEGLSVFASIQVGLGVETAKNVALAQSKFLGESAFTLWIHAVFSTLNAYVPVRNLGGKPGQEITVEHVQGFQVVVLCNVSYAKQLEINDWTHANGVCFIAAETHGLFGSIFNDFGPSFTCGDPTGEQPLTDIISSIDETGLVTYSDEKRHSPYTFEIGDAWSLASFGVYKSGGIFTQVKMPKIIHFVRSPVKFWGISLTTLFRNPSESLKSPDFFITDFAKFDRPVTLHAGFQTISEFRSQRKRLPRLRNTPNVTTVVSLTAGDIPPLVSVICGFVAQEVLKASSAKFHPMVQPMYFDSLESLPMDLPSEAECQPSGSRYDAQIAVFGRNFHEKITNHRQFLVGSGAIGCEMLKNWSMMGLASGTNGAIQVTDLDTIEKSKQDNSWAASGWRSDCG